MQIPQQLLDADAISAHLSKSELIEFVKYTKHDYRAQWFHEHLCHVLDKFARQEIMRLMVFMPPQHGKSELVSRRFPAYLLGRLPELRIAGLSYNDNFAKKFNRQVQRIIESDEYAKIFPDTKLNSKNVVSSSKGSFLKNSHEFEVVNKSGSYMAVGVGGGITGNPVDVAILDDVIKGRAEADSKTYRDKLWEWWSDDVGTRVRERTQILITLTRWHEDDICGRILADPEEAEKWTIIKFPALKENDDDPNDPREIGESLWEEEKSKVSLLDIKRKKARTFLSLYQQRPTAIEGNLIKRKWFSIISPAQFAAIINNATKLSPRLFTADTAYTEESKNDPSGLLCFMIIDEELFILNFSSVRLEFPRFIKYLKKYIINFSYGRKSLIFVEPKATGKSVVQTMKKIRVNGKLVKIKEDKAPDTDKFTRASGITETLDFRGVSLIKGPWNDSFLDELSAFPNGSHDEAVDLLVMAVDKWENGYTSGGLKASH